MEDYLKAHLKFPLATLVFTIVSVLIFRGWPAQRTTLVLSAVCIVVSVGLMAAKYSSFGRHGESKYALVFNICLVQIVAAIVAIIAASIAGALGPRLASLGYIFVLCVALTITGNLSIFGGGSLIVIILSSAILYWVPVLKALVYRPG